MPFATATGASGAAVTLTIPADGSAVRKISWLQIVLYAVAAVAGGAVPVLVTTTNLNGLAFTFNSVRAIGTAYPQGWDAPKLAQASGAVTVVCPATTSVIWRVNAYYENG